MCRLWKWEKENVPRSTTSFGHLPVYVLSWHCEVGQVSLVRSRGVEERTFDVTCLAVAVREGQRQRHCHGGLDAHAILSLCEQCQGHLAKAEASERTLMINFLPSASSAPPSAS